MSIYGTELTFSIHECDNSIEIDVQVVPAWVDYEIDYLPSPRLNVDENEGYIHPRCVLLIPSWSGKAGVGYGSQQYHYPIHVMTGEAYEKASFRELMDKIAEIVSKHNLTQIKKCPCSHCGACP